MSGIFRKCEHGRHFTKHLKKILLSLLGIITLGLINFSSAYISQQNISNYNLEYISTLTWNDMGSSNFSYIFPDSDTYCLSINDGVNIGSSNLSINNAYCHDNVCTSSSMLNNYSSYRYINTTTNITYSTYILKFTPNTTTTELNNFYSDNFVCYTPFSGYLSNSTYTYMNTAYLRGFNSTNFPNLSVSVYKVKSNSCDCSQYENDLLNCQSSLSTATGNLATCQSELTQCQNDYASCSNSLGNCGAGLNSCQSALGNCMQGNIGTGDYNWSALFINNIQHIGAPIINITIPEEIARDYTGNENSFDLVVDGYGYDEEKMLNMINTQNYKPTSEEMASLVGKFADFVPLLGVCILFLFIRYIIKKVFRF